MRKLHRVTAFLRAELTAMSSLIPVIVLSALIVFTLTRSSVTLANPSFQSPVDTPTTAPTEPPAGSPTESPVEPSPEPPPGASPEPTTPPSPPMQTPPVSPISPTITTGPETPVVEPDLTPTEGAPTEEPAPPATGRQVAFVDTCVLGFSYLWLCLGGVVLLLFVLGVALSFVLRRT